MSLTLPITRETAPSGSPTPAAFSLSAVIGRLDQRQVGRRTSILQSVVREAVIPELVGQNLPSQNVACRRVATDPRAPDLARLLVAPDPQGAVALIDHARAALPAPWPLYAELIEPAARLLGDFWADDHCSDADITIGLGRLQSSVRRLCRDEPPPSPTRPPGHTVLIAPEPGEPHRLGAAMDSEVLWQAGWAARCEFPGSDAILQEMLAARWFDALDLSVSTSVRRDHWLPKIHETILQARRASRNPRLVVVIGGRLFHERSDAGMAVGADAATTTSLDITTIILRGLNAGSARRRG